MSLLILASATGIFTSFRVTTQFIFSIFCQNKVKLGEHCAKLHLLNINDSIQLHTICNCSSLWPIAPEKLINQPKGVRCIRWERKSEWLYASNWICQNLWKPNNYPRRTLLVLSRSISDWGRRVGSPDSPPSMYILSHGPMSSITPSLLLLSSSERKPKQHIS